MILPPLGVVTICCSWSVAGDLIVCYRFYLKSVGRVGFSKHLSLKTSQEHVYTELGMGKSNGQGKVSYHTGLPKSANMIFWSENKENLKE